MTYLSIWIPEQVRTLRLETAISGGLRVPEEGLVQVQCVPSGQQHRQHGLGSRAAQPGAAVGGPVQPPAGRQRALRDSRVYVTSGRNVYLQYF